MHRLKFQKLDTIPIELQLVSSYDGTPGLFIHIFTSTIVKSFQFAAVSHPTLSHSCCVDMTQAVLAVTVQHPSLGVAVTNLRCLPVVQANLTTAPSLRDVNMDAAYFQYQVDMNSFPESPDASFELSFSHLCMTSAGLSMPQLLFWWHKHPVSFAYGHVLALSRVKPACTLKFPLPIYSCCFRGRL